MVTAVRAGESMRSVARRFGVSLCTVQHWVARAGNRRLDRVDFGDRRAGACAPANRTAREVEDRVLEVRKQLKDTSALGEYGAQAIHRALAQEGQDALPCVRTLGRILSRRGVLDARARVRHPAPPPGWYLPEVARGLAELDSFDLVEGLAIKDGAAFEVLNGISLRGGLACAFVLSPSAKARSVAACLEAHWREAGLPGFVQFDNDAGEVRVFERTFLVDAHWGHRLVRCEVDLDADTLRCYALRRRAPEDQPLLAEWPYRLVRRKRPFHE